MPTTLLFGFTASTTLFSEAHVNSEFEEEMNYFRIYPHYSITKQYPASKSCERQYAKPLFKGDT
jgi:hypothetical protein